MRSLSVVNMKGGVGKTTTAIHLAAAFANAGRRVLLVDADPQGNVGHVLRLAPARTIADLMLDRATLDEVIVRQARRGIDVIAASPSAFALETQLSGAVQRETILSRRLRAIEDQIDVLVIDTSPAMGLLSYNALLTASEVVIPIGMDAMAVIGARQTLDGIREIRQLWPDRRLPVAAAVPTAVNLQTHASRATLEALEAEPELGVCLFRPGIRQCIDLTYAAAVHQTIWEYAPRSRAAADYLDLAAFIDPALKAEEGVTNVEIESPAVVRAAGGADPC